MKQLRLCICKLDDEVVGLIDLFDFDPKNKRAGLGIVIKNSDNYNQGIGNEAINLLINYSFSSLDIHQIFANVIEDNEASLHVFKKLGFEQIGVKKDWIFTNGSYKNEVLFQKIKS